MGETLLRALRAGLADRGGGLAVITAIALPAVLMLGVGAIQLQAVTSFRQRTQEVADSAALWGASQVGVTSNGVLDRTDAWANGQLQDLMPGATVKVSASSPDRQSIKVVVDGHTPSFFVNLFPPGGFYTHAQSVAQTVNKAPLCILVFGTKDKNYWITKSQNLNVKAQGVVSANACAVHSDQDITVSGSARVTALDVQAVGKAKGAISPAAGTGAAYIPDPFSSVNVDFPTPCAKGHAAQITIATDTVLPAGLHCEDYQVQNGARLTLSSGEHYFGGDLQILDTSTLSGSNVVIDFSKDSKFDFNGSAQVSLSGRTSGPMAGFVIVSDRENNKNFTIESDHVTSLVGTVYISSATLIIDGKQKVAQQSPWTVIVAQAVQVQGTSNLVINSDYAATTVPVPSGVGPSQASARLVQ